MQNNVTKNGIVDRPKSRYLNATNQPRPRIDHTA